MQDAAVQEQLAELQNDVDEMRGELIAAKKEQNIWRKRREQLERSSQVSNIHTRQVVRPCTTHKVRPVCKKI